MISEAWLQAFDEHMKVYFTIDHKDAGLNEEELLRYRDLEPREAALVFGENYDLARADR